jgi:hypothetical protein
VALANGRDEEAWSHVEAILEPTQQLLPEALNAALEVAVQAKAKGEAGARLSRLDRAIELAQEMGYL